jgi:6-phosphofructo-2-kinase
MPPVSKRLSLMHCLQVGLPARGKSFLSNKLMRYLKVCPGVLHSSMANACFQWLEYEVKVPHMPTYNTRGYSLPQVFNVGQLRRTRAKARREQYVNVIISLIVFLLPLCLQEWRKGRSYCWIF